MQQQKFQLRGMAQVLTLFSLILDNRATAEINLPVGKLKTEKINHFVIFEEVGQMASSMTYIHVQIPLNISNLYAQCNVYETGLKKIINSEFKNQLPHGLVKSVKTTAEFMLRKLHRKLKQFQSVDNSLPLHNPREKREVGDNTFTEEDFNDLYLSPETQAEVFRTYLHNLNLHHGENHTEDFYIHNRNKRQLKEIFNFGKDLLGTFFGTFSAYQIQGLKLKVNGYLKDQQILAQVTSRFSKELYHMKQIVGILSEYIEELAKREPEVIALSMNEQMDIIGERMDITVSAIQALHDRKLAVNLLSEHQLSSLFKTVSDTAHEEGYKLLPTQISDLFQIETSYVRRQDDIILILHVPCINQNEMLTIYKHVPFPMPLPKQLTYHDMTIKQAIFADQLSDTDYKDIFNQSDLSFEAVEQALFVQDEHNLIAIGKDNAFKVISPIELASCIQKSHVYLCDKHHVLENDLRDSCLGSLYLRSETGVQRNCKFEKRRVKEMVYQINDLEHLIYSPNPNVYTMNCKNGSRHVFHLEKTSKITIEENCVIQLEKHTIKSDSSINLNAAPLTYSWNWDPLEMPAINLEDMQRVDFMMHNLRKDVKELVREHNETDVNTLFLSTVTDSSKFNFFSLFFWITSAFIIASTIYKLYDIWPKVYSAYNNFFNRPNNPNNMIMYMPQQPALNPHMPPNAPQF